ncbi:MAG: TonB-dependent receptor [Deltaproteobacteria bacterium]|jgi:TonB-linked SusC/RagA family outer membrane protein|nr:TonB-dependent receptor [Deltaproteobacteria bacterium]
MSLNKTDYWKLALLLFLLAPLSLFAQTQVITGSVTDVITGEVLPGVTVISKGTTTGTVTDLEGYYSINVARGATLVFSYVGYANYEVLVESRTTIDVQMGEETTELDEVVVIGYGTQRKRNLTGTIAKVSGDLLTETPVSTFAAGLQGKAAGVQIIQSNGMAGAGSAIRIRGISSISAGGDPLIIVDGIPINQDQNASFGIRRGANTSAMATINPNDIESLEILKDASAAAIYGSRGANGVILITTKRGKSKQASWDFSYRAGVVKETKKLDFLNNMEWLQLHQEAYENDAIYGSGNLDAGAYPDLPGGVTLEEAMATNTDWQDLMLHNGFSQEANLAFNKGSDKLRTYVGLSYSDQGSYLAGNNYQRLSGRLNFEYKITEKITAGINFTQAMGVNNRVEASWAGGLGSAQSNALPIWPVWVDDTTYFDAGANPVRSRDNKVIKSFENRSLGNAYLNINPINGLIIRADYGIDYLSLDENYYENEVLRAVPYAESRVSSYLSESGKVVGTYDFIIQEDHTFQVLLGTEFNQAKNGGSFLSYDGLTSPIYTYDILPDSSLTREENNPLAMSNSFISFFTRVHYNYKGKYLFSGSMRTDGSSRFGENIKYGYFPAGSVGWIVTEEEFLENSTLLSFLKLKASFGYTGNAEISNMLQWGTTNINSGITYNNDSIIFRTNLANPDITWEKNFSYDLGIVFGILKDRIYGELTYYNKQTQAMLLEARPQASSGWGAILYNVGEMENKGVEFMIKSRNLTGNFKWTTDLNLGFNRNKVLDVGTASPDALAGTGDTRVIAGHPIGVNYLVRFSHVDPADGMPVFFTKDGEETKVYNVEDRVIVGKPYPDFIGGINNTLSFKGFDMSFLFNFSYGNQIYDDAGKRLVGRINGWNQSRMVLDRWRQPGDITDIPRLTLDGALSGIETDRNTDEFLYDGSYIRLKQLTFGYNFPESVVQKMHLKNLRLYFAGTNLFTFTKYPGSDPEIFRDMENVMQKNLSPSVTYLTPPQAMTFNVGVNVTF